MIKLLLSWTSAPADFLYDHRVVELAFAVRDTAFDERHVLRSQG